MAGTVATEHMQATTGMMSFVASREQRILALLAWQAALATVSTAAYRTASTARYQTGHEKIDPVKPLVPQVGALGPAYDEWTHEALPGIPRLFGPDWMEACSKTPWWLIPLIWIPLSITCMGVAIQKFDVAVVSLAWRAMTGFALWHFLVRNFDLYGLRHDYALICFGRHSTAGGLFLSFGRLPPVLPTAAHR
jgi:hypothetical protein